MRRCSNSHKGCPELARGGAVHYCTDCYHAWHECVGTAQLAERDAQITALQAEVAEYAAFKASVVALYTTDFMGKVTLPDPTSLLPRIEMDRMIAQAARTAMHRDGKAPDKGVPLNLRSHLTVQWLKGLKVRLHPTAQAQPDTGTRQLDRIESLSKQAATNGPGGWPFAAFLVGAIVAYFIK